MTYKYQNLFLTLKYLIFIILWIPPNPVNGTPFFTNVAPKAETSISSSSVHTSMYAPASNKTLKLFNSTFDYILSRISIQ